MRKAWKVLRFLLIAAVLTGFAVGGMQLYHKTYVNLGGISYRRDSRELVLGSHALRDADRLAQLPQLQVLDLRDAQASPEQYEAIAALLPQCRILWDLPFQGQWLPRSTRELTLHSLTLEELPLLDYLDRLYLVDGRDCPDYEALYALQQRRPECRVYYSVDLDGHSYDCAATELVLHSTREEDLTGKLRCLPRLERVRFTGSLPDRKAVRSLEEEFPQTAFSWELTWNGLLLDSSLQELDLSGSGIDSAAELDALLRWFPRLQRLYLDATTLPQEALLALERGYPGLTIYWDLTVASLNVGRDARELDLSGHPIQDLAALEEQLLLFPQLERVYMSDCGVSSADMAALGARHEGIRFIWTVDLGGIRVRTDEICFAPNKNYIPMSDETLQDLQYCVDMVCIDIGHNRDVTHCRWAANMPHLKYLVIADTSISDLSPLSGLQELVFLEVFTSPVRDYRPLLTCRALEDLNLGYTYGDPKPVMEMTWLKRLWWPGSLRVLTPYIRNQLREKLPEAKFNFVAGSSTGEGWREGQHYYDMRDLLGMPYMTG